MLPFIPALASRRREGWGVSNGGILALALPQVLGCGERGPGPECQKGLPWGVCLAH